MRQLVVRLNPLVLVSFGFASLLGSFAIRDLPSAVAGVVAYAVAAVIFLPSWRYPLACLALCGVSAGLVAYSAWRLGNSDHAPVAAMRILVLAWPGAVAVGFVDPSRLGDYVAQGLRVPARFVASFVAVLQRVTSMTTTWQQVDRTRRARGLGPGRNPVAVVGHAGSMTFAMLASSLRGASRMSIAMDARGFATAQRRTWAEPAPWSRLDVVGLAVSVALGAVPVVARLLT
ncbi:energy-coupling factor transporter transmembrane component T family protein [Aeromicrobium stalagmiti]|uniref:energy-coupling factor transporter transmembrane component T family protein n=1 Tax=Aeromicrobium stalagmiti TaxID=2738988 RepID=UPI001569F5FB|nr:energy-coupling factor transporter transmembrane component T [Aeromicrobium stalagmiti]NRQ48777.1 energy-coupling factor transporter transmembrane protein EcfT [Aeromicrobium stalagmiti]